MRMMQPYYLSFSSSCRLIHASTIVLLFLSACNKNPTAPIDQSRNARSYDWVRDTLADGSYQSLMQNMWGSSASDIYVVGHASTNWTGKIWHYDGLVWSDLTYAYVQAFQITDPIYFHPLDVFGFGPDDVWIVGARDTSTTPPSVEKGFILHYSGGLWQGTWLPTANGHYSVGGVSSSDLWVGSGGGQLFHYYGNAWNEISLSDSITTYYIKAISSNDVYLSGAMLVNDIFQLEYYHWNGTSWAQIDSKLETDPNIAFALSFDVISNELYSANYSTISQMTNPGVWQQVFNDPSARLKFVVGFGQTNAFAMGTMNDDTEAAYHCDGYDWIRIEALKKANARITSAWSDDNNAFLLEEDKSPAGATFQRTYVLRGK